MKKSIRKKGLKRHRQGSKNKQKKREKRLSNLNRSKIYQNLKTQINKNKFLASKINNSRNKKSKNFNNINKSNLLIKKNKMIKQTIIKLNKLIKLKKIIINLNLISFKDPPKFVMPQNTISKCLSYPRRKKINISKCQLLFLMEARKSLL